MKFRTVHCGRVQVAHCARLHLARYNILHLRDNHQGAEPRLTGLEIIASGTVAPG
jgi:hypothetical protein